MKGKVYLFVSEICDYLDISRKKFNKLAEKCSIAVGPGHQTMLLESDYNNILFNNPDLFDKNGGHEEITKVASLRASFNEQKKILPLKHLFFPEMDDAAELKANIEQARKETLSLISVSNYYKEALNILNDKEYFDRDVLKENNLDIQFFSELNIENGSAGLSAYIVGPNIFYSIFLDDSMEEDWRSVKLDTNGNLLVHQLNADYELEECTHPVWKCDRDFRKYGVFENLAWCATNMPLENEWRDEVNCNCGTVYFNLNLTVLVKLFNPYSFKNIQLIEGLLEIQ